MEANELKTILEQHQLWLDGKGGARADLRGADLRWADLQDANLQDADLRGAGLRWADLQEANLQDADLQWADLRSADLQDANLRWADLRSADLQHANLRSANLHGANLKEANLRDADLDFSCLPLSCGSRGIVVDRQIAAQIAAHFCALNCDDADILAAQAAILEVAKTSHRAKDLGLLEESEMNFTINIQGALTPTRIVYNPPATICWFGDKKTVAMCSKDDKYDPAVGVMVCIMRRVFGDYGDFEKLVKSGEWQKAAELSEVRKELAEANRRIEQAKRQLEAELGEFLRHTGSGSLYCRYWNVKQALDSLNGGGE